MKTTYEQLIDIIVKAVPGLIIRCGCGDRLCEECVKDIVEYKPINLEDVLMAVHKQPAEKRPMYFNCGCDGGFYEVKYTYPDGNKCVIRHNGIGNWKLGKPLQKQSEETLTFLLNILS